MIAPVAGQRTVIALFGPTAVGKTAVALELADLMRAGGEDPVAISADALQVYRGLEVLTGAASAAERSRLEHRLLSFVPVTESFSVGRFMPLAHAEIDGALENARRPIVVGGTGLYLRAALADLELAPPPPPALRRRLDDQAQEHGSAALHAQLTRRAPWAAARIEPGDRTRVVRALELVELGALEPRRGDSELWTAQMRHPTLLAGLTMEREALRGLIAQRVEAMVAAGAEAEVRRADAAGASRTARAAVGFRELLAGDIEAMKRRSFQYAKRQLTWMRKLAGVREVDVTGRRAAEVAAEVLAGVG